MTRFPESLFFFCPSNETELERYHNNNKVPTFIFRTAIFMAIFLYETLSYLEG